MFIHKPYKGYFLKLVPVLVLYVCVLKLKKKTGDILLSFINILILKFGAPR